MKRTMIFTAGGGLALAALLAGCNSTRTNEIQQEQVSQGEDIRQLQEKIGQLHSDVQAVAAENDALKAQVAQLKGDLAVSHDTNSQYQKDIQRLDDLVKKLDTAREQDRKLIVDEVSGEISRLSKKIPSAPPPAPKPKPAAPHVEQGVQHVVAKGDTLTAIAQAYGVSVKQIKEANHLGKAELKVGQKLFIPKK